MNEWISVKDRVPDREDRFAILYRYKEQPFLKKFIADYDPIDERWRNQLDDITIEYWLDLPEPPEEIT